MCKRVIHFLTAYKCYKGGLSPPLLANCRRSGTSLDLIDSARRICACWRWRASGSQSGQTSVCNVTSKLTSHVMKKFVNIQLSIIGHAKESWPNIMRVTILIVGYSCIIHAGPCLFCYIGDPPRCSQLCLGLEWPQHEQCSILPSRGHTHNGRGICWGQLWPIGPDEWGIYDMAKLFPIMWWGALQDSRDCWANGVEEYAMNNNIVSEVTEEHETEFVGCLAYLGWYSLHIKCSFKRGEIWWWITNTPINCLVYEQWNCIPQLGRC